uniref:Helicase-associated domain-containing protein n=1 Tax=Entomoneis paludosa TaxID=265537 RepID=A0A6U3B117_9STRA
MSSRRMELLDQLNFDWNPQDTAWMSRFEELKEYVRTHGFGSVPTRHENPTLYQWCYVQRKHHSKHQERLAANSPPPASDNKPADNVSSSLAQQHLQPTPLTKERIALLDSLGFPWVAGSSPTNQAPPPPHYAHHPHAPMHPPSHAWHAPPKAGPPPHHHLPPPPNYHHHHMPPQHHWDYHYHHRTAAAGAPLPPPPPPHATASWPPHLHQPPPPYY